MTGSTVGDRLADGEAGTSIVEAMVATLLVAVGVLAVMSSIGAADRATSAGDRRSTAVRLADGELEVVRSYPYEEVGIAVSAPGYVRRFEGRSTVTGALNRVEGTGRSVAGRTEFDIRRHVTWGPIDVNGSRVDEGFKLVTVIVSWSDPSGDHEIRLDTGLYADGSR